MVRLAREKESLKNKKIKKDTKIYQDSNNSLFKKENQKILKPLLIKLFNQKNHYFSFENFLVFEQDNEINAIISYYPHEKIKELKINAFNLIKSTIKNIILDDLEFNDKLSETNEIHIDILIVREKFQGKGIGSQLIKYLQEIYKASEKYHYLSLNVEVNNIKAKKLYQKLNFKDTSKLIINNHLYNHMCYSLKENYGEKINKRYYQLNFL